MTENSVSYIEHMFRLDFNDLPLACISEKWTMSLIDGSDIEGKSRFQKGNTT